MEERLITEKIKNNNVINLEFASKEMARLAKRLKKCNVEAPHDEDKLGASIVEASVFLNCFGIASGAFTRMVNDLRAGEPKGDVLFYLKNEFDGFYEGARKNKEEKTEEKG